ncbi:hypothetical protein BGZ76_000630 [Entomortierella beljakovae]|nr:hypothetical protein BGZ76_000630 [Entomortierella beljakovae]
MPVTGSAFLDFVIGFAVSLLASVMNAAGLNLLKLDHVKNSALPSERQRNECGRPMWHVGLYLYIISQLAGSTVALNFLKTQWVAPLGSIALIFNFVFARVLVGTQITRNDVYGTIVVMASVIWIVVFGGMNSSGDFEENLTLEFLKGLFARAAFIIYFSILNAIIFAFLALGMYAYWAISLDDESGQLRKNMKKKLTNILGTNRFARASGLTLEGDEGLEAEARDLRLKKVVAMIMSACGGLLASETLLLAKSGVKLITSTLGGDNQFNDNMSYFILFVLVFTAILQVYCLNTGLKLYDSVLVVPTFYGFYTAFGLINSIVYLDQLGDYEPWVLLLVLVGITVLIYGVRMLSAPKPEQTPSRGSGTDTSYDDEDEDAHEMELRSKGGKSGKSGLKASLKKKISSKRKSQHGPGMDEENDAPSMYGSQRGILDPDDIDSEISTIGGMGSSSVGGTSTRGRGMSFTSKSSFQSDPFRTPKDCRSINEGFAGAGSTPIATGGHRRSILYGDHNEAPATHVLVDTTDIDLNDSGDEGFVGRDILDRQRKRQSAFNSHNALTQEKLMDTESDVQRPRIDTAITVTKTRRESERFSSFSAGAMSPSQFKAHLTNSSNLQQQQQQQQMSNADIFEEVKVVPRDFTNSASINNGARGHSVRWSTGSSKIDQVFEELNPFKIMKNSREPTGDVAASSSLPSSPLQATSFSSTSPSSDQSSGPEHRHGHKRQDSFTGRPSEWDVPGRKKRHSMLFGEAGRSNSASGGLGSSNSSPPTTPSPTSATMQNPYTLNRSNSSGKSSRTPPNAFSTGEWVPQAEEYTPSPRTSRIMSSPEIQLGPILALAAATASTENSTGNTGSNDNTSPGTSAYKNHYFTGAPAQTSQV